jgi:hypothetical protein
LSPEEEEEESWDDPAEEDADQGHLVHVVKEELGGPGFVLEPGDEAPGHEEYEVEVHQDSDAPDHELQPDEHGPEGEGPRPGVEQVAHEDGEESQERERDPPDEPRPAQDLLLFLTCAGGSGGVVDNPCGHHLLGYLRGKSATNGYSTGCR